MKDRISEPFVLPPAATPHPDAAYAKTLTLNLLNARGRPQFRQHCDAVIDPAAAGDREIEGLPGVVQKLARI
jgi:hypothetical protein